MKLVVWLALALLSPVCSSPTPSAEARRQERQVRSNKADLIKALSLLLLDVEQTQDTRQDREDGRRGRTDGREDRSHGREDGRRGRESGKRGRRGRRIQAIRKGRQNEFGAEELTEADRERFGISESESLERFSPLEECEPTGFETRVREECEEVSEIECNTKNVTKFRSEIFERCKTLIDKSCKVTMTEVPKQQCNTGKDEKRCKTEYNIVEEKIYTEECNIVIKNICEENVKVPVDKYHKPVYQPHQDISKHHYQEPQPHQDLSKHHHQQRYPHRDHHHLQPSHLPQRHPTPIPILHNHVPNVRSLSRLDISPAPSPHLSSPHPSPSPHITPSSFPGITPSQRSLLDQFNGQLRRRTREAMDEETLQFNEGEFKSTIKTSRSPLIPFNNPFGGPYDHPAVLHSHSHQDDHPFDLPEIPHAHHDGKSSITTHELPAPYGCRSIATKECHKVPIVVSKKVPYETCISVPTVDCFLVLKEVAELECSPEVHVDCNDFEKKVPFLVAEEECEEVFFDECQEIEERVPVELCKNIRVDQESITIVRGRTIRKEGEKRRRKTTQKTIQKGTEFINTTLVDPRTRL